MSTLASLAGMLGQMPNIRPWDVAERSTNEAGTGLIQLADLKAKQAAEQEFLLAIKQNPALAQQLFGGSTIGSLQTAPAAPPGGGPPGPITQSPLGGGPAQQIPAYPDASRYANVSPQGGGPIPPDVMAQTMPQVTPPPQGTPTLATIGPQGGMPGAPQGQMQGPQNPLLEIARTNPRAAMLLQGHIQAQQQNQFKLEEQRLDWTSKKMGYFGQVLQGVNSPESYADAVQEIARVDPQAAARLPRAYSKEALIPFIKQATTVKENADLQIKLMHEQTEQGKFQVQLAQAGYQGLGDDVTSILKGYSDEQVKQFGGRTSPAAIQNAVKQAREQKPVPGQTADVTTELRVMKKDPWTASGDDLAQARKNIEERELIRTRAAEVQRGKTEQELRGDKTVSEAMGTKATNLFDTTTGETGGIARMKVRDYDALPAGSVKELSPHDTEQMGNIRDSVPIVAQLQTHIDKIYGPGGVLARMTPDERADLAAVPGRWATQYAQKYPEVALAQRFINSNSGALARALAGEKGAMAEGDVSRAKEMLPNLETTLKVWPPANIGIQSPDTRAVALGTMNSIVDMINGRVRTILGNEKFTHPKLHRYQTADEAQQAAGGRGTAAPAVPPDLTPESRPYIIPPTQPAPAVGLNPNLPPVSGQPTPPAAQPPAASVPAPGAPIFPPAPVIREPGAPPPTPPTATSTPAQDERYRRSLAPSPAPAPAPRTAPGRQSQATPGASARRLAGAPKYMELADVAEAMRQTGRSRREVEQRARELGYTVYGSKRPLPEETAVG